MNYKIGDKVTIRKDLVADKSYECIKFNKLMEKYRGMKATITNTWGKYYRIKEDNDDWFWTSEMFEPVEETIKISKWKDLDEVENEKYKIIVSGSNYLYISNNGHPNYYVSYLVTDALSKQFALDWLKLFGFNVEFEEKPKLTEEELLLLKAFDLIGYTEIYRSFKNDIFVCGGDVLDGYKYFKFINKGQTVKIKDLLKLEVEK